MRIHLLAIGQRPPAWVSEGFDDYQRRLPPPLRPRLEVLPPARRRDDLARARREETDRLLARAPAAARLIALDERGALWSTQELAAQLAEWQQAGRSVALLIGGADGLDFAQASSVQRWSLSRLTLPHALVRVVIAEQLYRAWSILQHHPYHRE